MEIKGIPAPTRTEHQADAVEAVMADVIAAALDNKPTYSARVYHGDVVVRLRGTPHRPPSIARFTKAFAEERVRRKALVQKNAEDAAGKVAGAFGDRTVELVPGEPSVDRRIVELVVTSIIEMKSPRVGDAMNDYCQLSRQVGHHCISEPVYRELLYTPVMVENVPHELMPGWWHRQLARLGRNKLGL